MTASWQGRPMASFSSKIFDPDTLRRSWSSAADIADSVGVGPAAPSAALLLLEQVAEEACGELGTLGPALELLFAGVREQLTRPDGAAQEGELLVLLEQIEDLLEARVRW